MNGENPQDKNFVSLLQSFDRTTERLRHQEQVWAPLDAANDVVGGDPERDVLRILAAEVIHEAIAQLPPREQIALQIVMGSATGDEIAEIWETHRSFPYQVEGRALRRLRSNPEVKNLRDLLKE